MASITKIEDRFEYRERGEFRCALKYEAAAIIGTAGGTVVGSLSLFFLAQLVQDEFMYMLHMACCLFILVMGAFLFTASYHGRAYQYDANAEEFVITGPKGHKEVLYYREVTKVAYKPLRLLGKLRGYKVTISTKYRDITYRYIFTRNKLVRSPKGSPFFIIEERAGLTEDQKNIFDL